MNQVPSLGRVVIYTDAKGREFAALISGVYEDDGSTRALTTVDLHVMIPPSVYRAKPVMAFEAITLKPKGELCGWRWPDRK